MTVQTAKLGTRSRRRSTLPPLAVFTIVFTVILLGAPDIDDQVNRGFDHCCQMCVGRQICFGRRPFVDIFPDYGPLASYTSALGLTIHDSLLPETLFSTTAYAVAIALLFSIARRGAGLGPALAATLVLLLLLARFYKWYFWLFPVLTLFLLSRLSKDRRATRWLAIGVVSGLAFLYRTDLGMESLAFSLCGIVALMIGRRSPWDHLRAGLLTLLGMAIPLGIWSGVLVRMGGTSALRNYVVSYVDCALGATHALALPVPLLTFGSLRELTSYQTGLSLLFALLPAMAGLGLALAAYEFWSDRLRGPTRLLAMAGLGGLLYFPQALHRSDVHHLLQTLPLFALASCLLLHRLWSRRDRARPLAVVARRGLVAALLALLALAIYDVRPGWAFDYFRSREEWPWHKLAGLSAELDAAHDSPSVDTARFLRKHCGPHDTILTFCYAPNILFFSHCRAAGLVPFYSPGFLTHARWQGRNLLQIVADHPKYVVLGVGMAIDGKLENDVSSFSRSLWDYVQREYPVVAWRSGPYVVQAQSLVLTGPPTRKPL